MATVTYEGAQRVYPGSERPAVDDLDLEIADGELMVLVGPSGCGKSTSLRMLAGLEEVTGGRVLIDDADVSQRPARERDIAMVFQNYALYPHMSVRDNMGFALKMAGVGRDDRYRRVAEAASLLDLSDFLDRKPKALSGGQRQRVAMGRAIVREPRVFCMDEPLSNLDAKLRVSTRNQIAALQRRLGTTTVYVTHDQVEAMTMGDRVAVLEGGTLQQVDTPLALYDRPANLFVAGFIGSPGMNLLPGTVAEGRARVAGAVVALTRETASAASGEITVGVRPEHWRVVSDEDTGGIGGDTAMSVTAMSVTVDFVEELGADAYLHGTVGTGEDSSVVVRVAARHDHRRGETLRVVPDPEHLHVFDTASGARL